MCVRANVIGHKQGHDEDSFKLLKEMKGFSYEVKCKLFRKGGSEVQIQSVFKLIDRFVRQFSRSANKSQGHIYIAK